LRSVTIPPLGSLVSIRLWFAENRSSEERENIPDRGRSTSSTNTVRITQIRGRDFEADGRDVGIRTAVTAVIVDVRRIMGRIVLQVPSDGV